MSDSFTPDDVARRLGQVEHLLNEILERQERNFVKIRLAQERAIEKVGLELTEHRNLIEGTGLYSSERVKENDLENRLFERDRQGWKVVGLSLISTPSDERENLFSVVFRQSSYYEAQDTEGAIS